MTQPQVNTAPVQRNKRANRRQPPKRTAKAKATRNALGLGPNIAVRILDLSEAGVRLLLKEELPVGREFEVVLESAASRPVKMLAEVIWSVATAEGQFCVGARFQKMLPYAALQALSW